MTNYKARPTVYKGVKMRSRLEAGFAQWLDEWNVQWVYEPGAFAGEHGQYLPDFRLDDMSVCGRSGVTVYVEVKPQLMGADARLDLAHRMRVIFESEPDAFVVLVESEGSWARQPQFLPGPTWEENIGPAEGAFSFLLAIWMRIEGGHLGSEDVLAIVDGSVLDVLKDGPWVGQWWAGTPRRNPPAAAPPPPSKPQPDGDSFLVVFGRADCNPAYGPVSTDAIRVRAQQVAMDVMAKAPGPDWSDSEIEAALKRNAALSRCVAGLRDVTMASEAFENVLPLLAGEA